MDFDELFRETMSVDLTNLLGENSILVMGPGTSTSCAKFPLRQYAIQDSHPSTQYASQGHADKPLLVVEYTFSPATLERTEPGQIVHGPCQTTDIGYGAAYTSARAFAEGHAARLGIPVRDNLSRRPAGA